MRAKLIIIVVIAIICASAVYIILNIADNREYSDVSVENELTTISDCVECAKSVLNIKDEDVYLSDFNITYDSYKSKYAKSVNISFVSINELRFLSPYTLYSITLDIKNGVATGISKEYCKYIVYDDLNFKKWKLDLDSALTDEKVAETLKNHEIMQSSEIKIITYNYAWDYIFTNSENQSVRVKVNPL